jgi:branched-chain amino acid transport system substrate-binding protein
MGQEMETNMRTRKRRLAAFVILATVVVAVVAGFTLGPKQGSAGDIYLGMDTPLTGPTSFVGQGDREAVDALVNYWNSHKGIRGRTLHVDVLDNASNPSQAVQNVQKFVSDPKYVGIIGSGNAAAAAATAPLATNGKIPFIATSPPLVLVAPPRDYVYIGAPTSRLFAYNEAAYLRKAGIRRVAIIADNGGFGREASAQAASLGKTYGYEVTDTTIFSPATTDFTSELTKVKNSDAQALWVITAQAGGITIVKQAKQLNLPQRLILTGASLSPQFLQGACPEMNGAVINGTIGAVWQQLPKSHPVRKQAAFLQSLVKHQISTFNLDAATAMYAFKTAMERGGFTREAINNAMQTKLGGVATPQGKLRYSEKNHSAVTLESMFVGQFANCQPKAISGAAFAKKK